MFDADEYGLTFFEEVEAFFKANPSSAHLRRALQFDDILNESEGDSLRESLAGRRNVDATYPRTTQVAVYLAFRRRAEELTEDVISAAFEAANRQGHNYPRTGEVVQKFVRRNLLDSQASFEWCIRQLLFDYVSQIPVAYQQVETMFRDDIGISKTAEFRNLVHDAVQDFYSTRFLKVKQSWHDYLEAEIETVEIGLPIRFLELLAVLPWTAHLSERTQHFLSSHPIFLT
eukprot:TRINITY_DN6058_c0_g1_i1.p1 TRINITY_DN6058_c0_g1~~TRINITY_DN6058_c0_g1_i1.p1  ORF type:complete len:230 (+),score=33.55 TRINITY_DN6058_c0_g1_i1:235-924(+)